MSKFNEYEKVERIEKEECRGLLEGKSYIFEKIDGANSQIYFDTNISYASRNRVLGIGDQLLSGDHFRGFYDWVQENSIPLYTFFSKYPNITLYGEWLVKHTVQYPTEVMAKFYCFDIMDDMGKFAIPTDPVWKYLQSMFNYPIIVPCDGIVENCTIEDLKKYLEMPSHFGAPYREGIVIKNYDFINKYGRNPYGKLLNKDFMEVKGKTKKNVNPEDIEVELTNTYCTKARVAKICEKIKDNLFVNSVCRDAVPKEIVLDTRSCLEMKDIPKIINMVFYDIITEDMNDMLKKFRYPTVDFKKFKFLVFDAAKKYFVEYLEKQN